MVAIPSECPHAHPQAVVVMGTTQKFATSGAELGGLKAAMHGVVLGCPASMRLVLQVLWSNPEHRGSKQYNVA